MTRRMKKQVEADRQRHLFLSCTSKRRYATYDDAWCYAKLCRANGTKHHLWAYFCNRCNGFHMTKVAQRGNPLV